MAESASSLLRGLAALRTHYGGDVASRRLPLLRQLEKRRLGSWKQVLQLHELLAFLRAYPDNREVLVQVDRMLAGFAARSDLRRHRSALADSGIAGTTLRYSILLSTASWLAQHWPQQLAINWSEFDNQERVVEFLDLLLPYCESPAIDAYDLPLSDWLDRLKSPSETDAEFLIRRFDALSDDPPIGERLFEDLAIPLKIEPGPGTPSRTCARLTEAPIVFQAKPLSQERPSLRREIDRVPLSVRSLSPAVGRRMIHLAREAMVTRTRDLDAFSFADEKDARVVEFADGLQFVGFGLRPERRLMLETSYGFLTVKNGVPIGYALASSLFCSTELAYNVFPTFRGAEAADVFARLLATVHHLFGSDAFAIEPYQLGAGNQEGLASGAWWFYYRLGFRPLDPNVRSVLREELGRMKADRGHRSSRATLRELARGPVFFYLGRARKDVMGRVWLGNIGLRLSDYLAERFGAEREGGIRTCAKEAVRLLGLESRSGFSRGERLAWTRWSPLVLILPGIEKWSHVDKKALVAVIRAKGGPRESDFVRLFDGHHRLRDAILSLSR